MSTSISNSVIVTGGNGLVGSHFIDRYKDQYQFELIDVSHPTQPIDITDQEQVKRFVEESSAQAIVHYAAFTDVTKAWQERDNQDGVTYRVNVLGTRYLAQAAAASNKHIILISTAYVFDGENSERYTENDLPHPIEWYGQTKWLAEQEVMELAPNYTILRIDQPFRSQPFIKQDTAHRVLNGLQQGSLYPQFANHYFGPTFIEDFSRIVDWSIRTHKTGTYHASSGEKWSDYQFACAIRDLHVPEAEVKQGDVEIYLQSTQRPYQRNTAMSNEKLTAELDFKLTTIQEALKLLV